MREKKINSFLCCKNKGHSTYVWMDVVYLYIYLVFTQRLVQVLQAYRIIRTTHHKRDEETRAKLYTGKSISIWIYKHLGTPTRHRVIYDTIIHELFVLIPRFIFHVCSLYKSADISVRNRTHVQIYIRFKDCCICYLCPYVECYVLVKCTLHPYYTTPI